MQYVRIAVLGADEKVCAFFDNSIPDSMHYSDACLNTFLQGSAYTLEIDTATGHADAQYLIEGNKVAFVYKGKDYMCNIVDVERTETEISVTCWGMLLELTNETREAYKSSGAMSLVQYINYIDPEHVLTLGINEVSDKKIANEWEGSQTILARLYSIATLFGAELEFITELNDNYTLKQIILNVYRAHDEKYQGVGEKRTDQNLRFGTEIETIRKKASIEDLFTAIHVIGKDGAKITGLNKKEYDSEGRLEYYTEGNAILAPLARDRFPSNLLKPNDGYILKDWTYDSDSKEMLYGQGLAQLKKYCVPQVTYEIKGYYDANIGDTFTIIDDGYKPTLILEARVTEQKEYFVDPSKNETTYSNVIELQSEIDPNLLAAMNKLIADKKLYTCNISTDNGIVFKNGIGSTTLTAQVKDGAADITDKYVIQWYKDGNALTATKSVTVNATDVIDKAVYKFSAFNQEGAEIGLYEVTVTNVDDGSPGSDGESTYTHIRYAMDADGTGMTDKPEGYEQPYIGIFATSDPEAPTDPTEYTWSKYVGDPGTDGESGIIISEDQPDSPYVGQLWQTESGESIKRWNGSEWVLWYMAVTNLNVENLAAIAATIGTVSNPYTTDIESEWSNEVLTGKITIGGAGIKSEYTQTANNWKGMWRLNPQSYYTELRDTSGDLREGVSVEPEGIYFYDYATKRWVGTSASKLSSTVVHKGATLSFADPTLLKGTVEFETQVLGATATIQRRAGTPISNTNALDITVRNVNGKGYVDVCANGSYVNGHLLVVSVMALVEV